MRRLLPILLIVTACAGGGGSWPTLARRPIEGPPPATSEPRKCAAAHATPSCGTANVAPDAAVAPQPPTAAVAIDDIPAKLAVVDRDLTDAAARLAAQRAAATAAAAAARGTGDVSPAWAKAQIELTALDRVGSQIGDLRERLDVIAGTLAAANAGGADVAGPLLTTGRLLARATTLQGEYDAATAALR